MPINSTDTTTGFAPDNLGRFRGSDRAGAWALDNLPYDLLEGYSKLAREGKYGSDGVNSIVGEMRRNYGLSRRLRRKGLSQRFKTGRRLGPRAGAIDTQIANTFDLPTALQQNQIGSSLRAENLGSRVQGLGGIQEVMQLLERLYSANRKRDDQGGFDLGGLLKTAALVASTIPSGGATAPAAAADVAQYA